MTAPRFESLDLRDELPAPGYYPSTITSARLRRSLSGNRMVQVIHTLEGVPPGHDRLSEYFVLEGASPRGLAFSRRRLVELYRACGFAPEDGEEIATAPLLGARLEVKVEHDQWQGMPRLRVVAHRPLQSSDPAVADAAAATPF
jgi:hypothetical protein